MGNRGMLALLVLVATGAIFWLLGGADLLRDAGEDADRDRAGGGDGGLARGGGNGPGAPQPGDRPGGDEGPILFGRAKSQRKGIGALVGRVLDFQTGEPVEAPRLTLTGTGYGGEAVALETNGDGRGSFALTRVAAGEGYALHVAGGGYERTLASISVAADATRDLGAIWLGERGLLEGIVLDEAGRGIADAAVRVHRGGSLLDFLDNLPDLMEQMDQDPVPLAQAPSGKAGRFRIENVDPGPIHVVVRAAGYRQAMVEAVMTAQGAAGGPLTIRLEPSRPLTGIVVDEHGRGVAGARVAWMDQNDMDSAFFGRQATRTDAGGRFRLDSPPTASAVAVVVAAEGYPTLFSRVSVGEDDLRLVLQGGVEVVLRILEAGSERAIEGARVMAVFGEGERGAGLDKTTYAHGATDGRGEALLAARAGVLQMLFMVHPERGTGIFSPAMPLGAGSLLKGPDDVAVKAPRTTLVFHVDAGRNLYGNVTDPEGRPIAGARCRVIGMMGIGATAVTDADGRYVMHGQSARIQMVIVQAAGYVQDLPGLSGGAAVPTPDARGDLQYDIVMRPAASVTGRVLAPDGKPVAGALVKATGSAEDAMLTRVLGTASASVTSAAGRYVLDGVRPGEKVRVFARRAGFLDGKSAEFSVQFGSVNAAPDLTLRRGSWLTVHVLDPAGTAVERARVEVSTAPHEDERVDWDPMSRWRNFADLRTDAEGKAVVESLPSGQVTVTATHEGFAGARKSAPVERLDGGEPTSAEVRVQLREAFTLRGCVLDDEGRAVAGASLVTASPPGAAAGEGAWVPTISATSDAGGRFVLEGLPDAPLELLASAEGHQPAKTAVDGPRAPVEVLLRRVSADAQKRLVEIQKALMEIYGQLSGVKDDAERRALIQRMQDLQREQARLQGTDRGG